MTSGVAIQSDGVGNNPAAIDINAGEQIGVELTTNFPSVSPSMLLGDSTAPGATWSAWSPGLPDGSASAPTASGSGSVPLVNATVELFAPLIFTLSSQSGPEGGGDIVVITGTHLAFATAVTFGGRSAEVMVAGSDQIIAIAPPHSPGAVDVTVTTAGGANPATAATTYTYLPSAGPPSPKDKTKPVISGLKLAPRAFPAAGSGPSVKASKATGATISYRSSEAVTARFRVQRKSGRRYVQLPGSFRHRGAEGENTLRFTGRLRNRSLKPGQYRLAMVARDGAGNRSKDLRRKFEILR